LDSSEQQYQLHPNLTIVDTFLKYNKLWHLSIYITLNRIKLEIVFSTLTGVNLLVGAIILFLNKKWRFVAQ
jgi:hypothetical protein